MSRPILLIDIDGVISVFGFDPKCRPAGRLVSVDGVLHFLSHDAARHLLGLVALFDLVWCSGWEDKADEHLPHALGLPSGLPHLTFSASVPATADRRHWKLAAIDRYAGADRALAWIDDAHDETCRAWAGERAAPTLLVATDPSVGLTEPQARELRDWALALGGSPQGPASEPD